MRCTAVKRFGLPVLLSITAHAILLTGWHESWQKHARLTVLRGTLAPPQTHETTRGDADSASMPIVPRTVPRVASVAQPPLSHGSDGRRAGQRADLPNTISSDASVAPETATTAVGEEVLARYRLDLAREAGRFSRYPAEALERHWEGTVVVAIDFAIPQAPRVALEASSGNAMLDGQALNLLRQALSAAVVPEAVRQGRAKVVVPIQFDLND